MLFEFAVVIISNSSFVSWAVEAPPGNKTKIPFESLTLYSSYCSRTICSVVFLEILFSVLQLAISTQNISMIILFKS